MITFSWTVFAIPVMPPPVLAPIRLWTITFEPPTIPAPALPVIALFSILQLSAKTPVPPLAPIVFITIRQSDPPVIPAPLPVSAVSITFEPVLSAIAAPPKPSTVPLRTVRLAEARAVDADRAAAAGTGDREAVQIDHDVARAEHERAGGARRSEIAGQHIAARRGNRVREASRCGDAGLVDLVDAVDGGRGDGTQ